MTEERVREIIRMSRNAALDVAIQLCEECARFGKDANTCAQQLKILKADMEQLNDVKVN